MMMKAYIRECVDALHTALGALNLTEDERRAVVAAFAMEEAGVEITWR